MPKCCLLLLFLAAFLLPAASKASCHPDDLRALRGFVGNLSGGGVLLRAAWSGASCRGWEGVGCDGASGRVTTLSLPGRGLAGPIPGASLTGLARLESLNLANNSRLVGTITSWIGELHHLRHLDLSHTSLVGEVPKSLQIRLAAAGFRSLGMAFTNRRAHGRQPNTITGTHNIVRSGTRNVVSGNHNTVISGNYNVVAGSHSTVVTGSENAVSGNNHVVFGKNHVVTGSHNTVSGSNNAVSGNHHFVSGRNHVVSGRHNSVSGRNNIVSGSNHVVSGNNKVVT